jgi:micrococcal nuclease
VTTAPFETSYEYRATVIRWVDGDTVDLNVDLGFHLTLAGRFRLTGIDTPERGRPGALEAHARAEALAPVGTEVLVLSEKSDKYGRWLGTILITHDGPPVNHTLVYEGLAKPYDGGTKDAS